MRNNAAIRGPQTKLEESQAAAARRIRELEHSAADEREADERLGEERDALQRRCGHAAV